MCNSLVCQICGYEKEESDGIDFMVKHDAVVCSECCHDYDLSLPKLTGQINVIVARSRAVTGLAKLVGNCSEHLPARVIAADLLMSISPSSIDEDAAWEIGKGCGDHPIFAELADRLED